jgi:DNA-binding SARP family transcriptional activator
MSNRQSSPRIQVYLLGTFRLVVDGQDLPPGARFGQKVLQFFKCLLTRPHHRIAEHEAAELFWSKSDAEAVAKTIGSTLSRIRAPLGWSQKRGTADLLLRDHGMISIAPEAGVWVDADEFERLLRQARTADDPSPLLEEADRLYAGPYLPDDRYEIWSADRREALERLRVELQFDLAQHRERRGDLAGASAALESVLRDDGCDERAAREVMLLHTRNGRRTDALRIYQQLVKSLQGELGMEPSAETVEVWRQVSAGNASPPAAARAPVATPPLGPPASPRVPTGAGVAPAPATASQPTGRLADDRLAPQQFTPAYPFPMPERLIGREGELTQLERLVQKGRTSGQVMLIGAPAGTGKSALLGALVPRARRAGFLCLVGGGYGQEGMMPLGPFQDALSDYLLWQPAERIRAELAGGLDDLALLIPELRYHLGLPDRPTAGAADDRSRLFATIHIYLRTLSERHPVLLCLEDLHAADIGTLALIELLARRLVRQRLVIVGTFRTEELRPGRPLSDLVTALRRSNAEQLDLKPLNRQRAARMVAALLEGQPSERLSDALYASTEGNPFFLEQLVLALREEGRIDHLDGTWRQVGDVRAVPTIVRDVVGQRLDRLSDNARQTLAMAAVLGHAFDYGALLAASEYGDDEPRLLEDIDEAFGAQILLETPSGYAFAHALLREVTYARLGKARQTLLHGRAGEALEQWAGARTDERAAELAHHFLLAGQSPAMRQKATRYSLEAGRRADLLSAHREALEHFTRVCELTDSDTRGAEPRQLLDALDGRGEAERNLADWQGCIATGRRIIAISNDPSRRARARNVIGRALLQTGDQAGAIEQFESGLTELRQAPPGPENAAARLHLMYQQAFPILLQGRPGVTLDLGRQMLALATELGDPRFLSNAHSVLAISHMRQGRADEGEAHYRLARDAAEQIENALVLAFVHENLGAHHYYFGNFAEARREIEHGRRLVLEAAGEQRSVLSFRFLSLVLLAEGDLIGAFEQNQIAFRLALEGNDRLVGECCEVLGAIQTARAEWEDAAASFEQALSTYQRVENDRAVPDALLGLGLVYERQGDVSRAEELYRKALDRNSRMDHPMQAVAVHRRLGHLLHRRGDPSGREHVERACALGRTMPQAIECPPALLALAELMADDDPAGAIDLAAQALGPAPTAEHHVEARLLLATQCARLGRREEALAHATAGLEIATRLDAPRPLGLAHLARARALQPASEAIKDLDAAIQQFELAGTPYERDLAQARSGGVAV